MARNGLAGPGAARQGKGCDESSGRGIGNSASSSEFITSEGEIELSTNPKRHPLYKHAADVIAERYDYGDFVPDTVILELFEISPDTDTAMTAQDWQRKSLDLLQMNDGLRRELLEEHRMMLVRDRNAAGRVIVKPSEQTRLAMKDLADQMRKLCRKAATRLVYVNKEQLSDDERKENAEAIANLQLLRSKQNKQLAGFSHKSLKAPTDSSV